MTRTDLVLRPATYDDLPAVARVHLAARLAAEPAMPAPVHPPEEVHRHFVGTDLSAPRREVWVAEVGGEVAGYAKLTGDWLDDLYVHPAHQRMGVASALFDLAAAARPSGFCLWVFETNTPARDFYARRGCIELERTDGAANEEHSPDIRVVWPGAEPLRCLRRLIDEVDDVLADVLLRRTALTRAVQRIKPSTERDPAREAEIVERLSTLVPDLEPDGVARIVDAIIGASLLESPR